MGRPRDAKHRVLPPKNVNCGSRLFILSGPCEGQPRRYVSCFEIGFSR